MPNSVSNFFQYLLPSSAHSVRTSVSLSSLNRALAMHLRALSLALLSPLVERVQPPAAAPSGESPPHSSTVSSRWLTRYCTKRQCQAEWSPTQKWWSLETGMIYRQTSLRVCGRWKEGKRRREGDIGGGFCSDGDMVVRLIENARHDSLHRT